MRRTKCVKIGNIVIGNSNPVAIQSMTNVKVDDIDKNVEQIKRLNRVGCELVRISVPLVEDVKCFKQIKTILQSEGINLPFIADVHFIADVAFKCLGIADKVRINPGNFISQKFNDTEEKYKLLSEFFLAAKQSHTPIRIGINSGSLSKNIIQQYGINPESMLESAKEYINVANSVGFNDIIFSFKSSDLIETIHAYRLADEYFTENNFSYPLHVGVTEAGYGQYGIIKSSIAIGGLLTEGIGDTIRVSLTGDPVNEIAVAKDIIQATGRRYFYPEIISCPSCGRTRYDIAKVVSDLEKNIRNIHIKKHVKIAIMGCVVNGLGEAGNADIACVGTDSGSVNIFVDGKCVHKNIQIEEIFELLNALVYSVIK